MQKGETDLRYRTGLNSESSEDKWGFMVRKQGDESVDKQVLRENLRGKGHLTGFSLKAGQGHQTSLGGEGEEPE